MTAADSQLIRDEIAADFGLVHGDTNDPPRPDLLISPARLCGLLAAAGRAERESHCAEVVDLGRQAALVAVQLADRAGQAAGLRKVALAQTELGDWEPCTATCGELLPLLRDLGDGRAECDTLTLQALSCTVLGLFDAALESLTVAHQLAAELGDPHLLYAVYNRLAGAHDGLGDFAKGLDFLYRALAQAEQLGASERYCILNNLADHAVSYCETQFRDPEPDFDAVLQAGLAHAEQALALADTPYREVLTLDNQGWLLGLAGQHARSLGTLNQARQLAERRGYPSLELATRQHLAGVLMLRGDAAAALPALIECRQEAERLREVPVEAAVVLELSAAYEQLGQFEQALRWHKHHALLERRLRSARASTRARIFSQHVELDRARCDAEVARHRSTELEAEKQALEALTRDLDERVNQDALTRLSNRHHLEQALPQLFTGAGPLSVAVVDIDHFKQVNDSFGHALGDAVLVEVATLLRQRRTPADLVARLGGEEFFLALPGLGLEAAVRDCQRIRRAVETHDWDRLRPGMRVTVSIGVCERSDEPDEGELVERADTWMYRAKRAGRNRVRWAPGSVVEARTTG